jgi:hypothetical protein
MLLSFKNPRESPVHRKFENCLRIIAQFQEKHNLKSRRVKKGWKPGGDNEGLKNWLTI